MNLLKFQAVVKHINFCHLNLELVLMFSHPLLLRPFCQRCRSVCINPVDTLKAWKYQLAKLQELVIIFV